MDKIKDQQLDPRTAAIGVSRTCQKCGFIGETLETMCPKCGRKGLRSVRNTRIAGAVLVLLASGLIICMSWISLWMYRSIGAGGTRFTGTDKDLGMIIVILAVVILISLAATIGGLWQLVFGKRNKLIVLTVLVLGLALIGITLIFDLGR